MGFLFKSKWQKLIDGWYREGRLDLIADECQNQAGNEYDQKYGIKILVKATKNKKIRLKALKQLGRVADGGAFGELMVAAQKKFKAICKMADEQAAVKKGDDDLVYYMSEHANPEVVRAAKKDLKKMKIK